MAWTSYSIWFGERNYQAKTYLNVKSYIKTYDNNGKINNLHHNKC